MTFTETGTVRQVAFKVTVVDTTVAGDTYTGVFIAGLMEGRSLQESMRRASRAAGIAGMRPGAAASIPGERKSVVPDLGTGFNLGRRESEGSGPSFPEKYMN